MSFDQVKVPTRGKLYVGSAPTIKDRVDAWADVVVLCAAEHQVPSLGDVTILRIPLADVEEPFDCFAYSHLLQVSVDVADRLRRGLTVLVTCYMGLNRACLVAGMSMRVLGMKGDEVVRELRRARGQHVLSNRVFESTVRSTMPSVAG